MEEKKQGFKTGWCGARDVPTIEPLLSRPLTIRETPAKLARFDRAPTEGELIVHLKGELAQARARIAELEQERKEQC